MKRRILQLLVAHLVAVSVISGTLAQQPAPSPRPSQSDESSGAQKRQESFEIVWKTVNQRFYDPNFGGVDWNKVHERYAPLVVQAQSDREFHLLLQQMLNELHQSHFVIIPKEAIPRLIPKHKPANGRDMKEDSAEAADDEIAELEADESTSPLDRIGYKLTERLSTGIGIDLRVLDGSAVITRVDQASAAARAGLRPGFVIKSVNGRSMNTAIAQLDGSPMFHTMLRGEIPQVLLAAFINGERRSPVQIAYFDSANRLRTIRITREKLKGEMSPAIGNLPAMYTEFETRQLPGGYGYIRFNAFVPILMKKVCAVLRSMQNDRGLILDLRGNQGGLLAMISGLTGLLETKTVALGVMQTRTGRSSIFASPQRSPYSGPIVVLVDGGTQSAAEMFASGLQQTGRATIIGEQSAGNTLPSSIVRLPTDALFQYGFANYQTVAGETLEGRGLAPDYVARLSRRTLLRGVDPQMAAALRQIKELASWARPSRGGVGRELIADLPQQPAKPAANKASPTPGKVSVVVGNAIVDPPPPEMVPPVKAQPPKKPRLPAGATVADPVSAGLPSLDQIVDHYIEAIGGHAVLEKLRSRVSKGSIELQSMGLLGSTEVYEQAPDKSTTIVNVEGLGVIQQTFDGTRAWMQHPLEGFLEYPPPVVARERSNADFFRELHFKELNPDLRVIAKERVGDREAYVLQSHSARFGGEKWYFDAQNGLLLRKGNTVFEDYREVDGMKLPFTVRDDLTYGEGVVVHMTEIKHNVAIDQSKFMEYPDCFTKPE